MISEAALQMAVDLAAWFVRTGYPYLGKPTLDLDGDFPLVMVWDDSREVTLMIACAEDELEIQQGLQFAINAAVIAEASGQAPTGAVGLAIWPGGWMGDDEITSRPIKHILGGE